MVIDMVTTSKFLPTPSPGQITHKPSILERLLLVKKMRRKL
jgi:hypothetical protein